MQDKKILKKIKDIIKKTEEDTGKCFAQNHENRLKNEIGYCAYCTTKKSLAFEKIKHLLSE